MPLLLYAVTEATGAAVDLPTGVSGTTVQSMEASGLTCFYSENSPLADSNMRATAMEFHQVVKSLFEQRDVIPFRFPTLLADSAQVSSVIQEHAAEYHDGLAKVSGRVQMEIRISYIGSNEKDLTAGTADSGADYLRKRSNRNLHMRSAAAALKSAGAELIEQWHEREYSDHLRGFALIARGSAPGFQRALAGAAIPSDLLARVSGPWPATEFLKEE